MTVGDLILTYFEEDSTRKAAELYLDLFSRTGEMDFALKFDSCMQVFMELKREEAEAEKWMIKKHGPRPAKKVGE